MLSAPVRESEIDKYIAICYVYPMKQIRYSKQATKTLRAMQPEIASKIISTVKSFALGKPVDAKKLSGSSYVRLRVGKWRVIVDDQGVVILVVKIAPRGGVYKGR